MVKVWALNAGHVLVAAMFMVKLQVTQYCIQVIIVWRMIGIIMAAEIPNNIKPYLRGYLWCVNTCKSTGT